MGWTMLYLFVALKIPILALGYIVWWAVHQEPETAEDPGDGGTRRRPHPPRPLPRTPRRGPHAEPAPQPPARVRALKARARQYER